MESEVETLNQDTLEPGMGNPESGSEDEAIALFNQRAQSKPEEDAETPDDQRAEADPEEAEEADPAEDEAKPEALTEVEYEGKTYKVAPELQKALLRQSDYSRKMNELGTTQKDYAQRIERADALINGAGEYAKAMAKVHSLDEQAKQFEGFDFDKLEAEDPARASVLAVKLLRLQQAREKAAGEASALQEQLSRQRSETTQAARLEMFKTLEKELKDWGPELGQKVTEYALSSGFKPDDLTALTDARIVIALDKARKFDAIQAGKAKALEKVEAVQKPVFKPGAARRVDKSADALARFQKSNSPEDAVALFQARARRG